MEEIAVVILLVFIIPLLVLISIPAWIVYGAVLYVRSVSQLVFGDGANDGSTKNGQG